MAASGAAASCVTPRCTPTCSTRVATGLAAGGLPVVDVLRSPIRGADGNVEFLVHCQKGAVPVATAALVAVARPTTRSRRRSRRMTRTPAPKIADGRASCRTATGRVARELARRRGMVARPRARRACALDDAPRRALDDFACSREEFTSGLDLAISLGGDGTMLRTVDLVYECGAAVLGVNVGQMGYLTEVEPSSSSTHSSGCSRVTSRSRSGWSSR